MHTFITVRYPPDYNGELHVYYEESLRKDYYQFHVTLAIKPGTTPGEALRLLVEAIAKGKY
jgi:hypothetical protein